MKTIKKIDISIVIHALISWCVAFLYVAIIQPQDIVSWIVGLFVGNIFGTLVNATQEYYFYKKGQPFNIYDVFAGWMFSAVIKEVIKLKKPK